MSNTGQPVPRTGESNTTSNDGAGAEVAKAKMGVDLPMRTMVGGNNITITQTADTIVFDGAAGAFVNQGGYNASTNTPDLDTSPSGSILNGWVWTCTVAGTFFTIELDVGDNLIANTDAPTVESDWNIVERNLTGAVTAAAALTDDMIIVGDGGAEAVKTTTIPVADIIDNTEHLAQIGSTGLLDGCELTANTTTVNIDEGEGEVHDNFTDPLNSTGVHHTFAGVTNLVMTNIGTTIVTFLGLADSTDTVTQQATPFTDEQRRDFWWIGFVVHLDNVNITSVGLGVNSVTDQNNSLRDLWDAVGTVTKGSDFAANGVNLTIDRAVGTKGFTDISYSVNRKAPNKRTMPSEAIVDFATMRRNGSGGFTTDAGNTIVDVGKIDLGNASLDTLGNNKYQVMRIYYFAEDTTTIVYGQVVYNSFDEAVAGISTEVPILNPLLLDVNLKCFLVVRGGGTDLSDASEVLFSNTGKFGNLGAGGAGSGGGGAQDYQSVYNISVTPHVTTTASGGAVTTRVGSGSDSDDIIVGQNAAGTDTFAVTGEGDVDLAANLGVGSTTDATTITAASAKTAGGLAVAKRLLVGTTLRVEGSDSPSAGVGLEMRFQSDEGLITAYNRDTSSYKNITINPLELHVLTEGTPRLHVTSSGVEVENDLTVGGDETITGSGNKFLNITDTQSAGATTTANFGDIKFTPTIFNSAHAAIRGVAEAFTNEIGLAFRTHRGSTVHDDVRITSFGVFEADAGAVIGDDLTVGGEIDATKVTSTSSTGTAYLGVQTGATNSQAMLIDYQNAAGSGGDTQAIFRVLNSGNSPRKIASFDDLVTIDSDGSLTVNGFDLTPERGTFTPSVGGTATYSVQDGKYTKIGNLVHIHGKMIITTIGTGSVSTVSGLPFTVDGTANVATSQGELGYYASLATAFVRIVPTAQKSATTFKFSTSTAATTSMSAAATIFVSGSRIDFSITYIATA